MHSDVINCPTSADLPTPWAPIIADRYVRMLLGWWSSSAGYESSTGESADRAEDGAVDAVVAAIPLSGVWRNLDSEESCCGAKLLLRERRRRNESPRFTTPFYSSFFGSSRKIMFHAFKMPLGYLQLVLRNHILISYQKGKIKFNLLFIEFRFRSSGNGWK